MKASPSSRRKVSKRSGKQNGSLENRSPSRQLPAAVRSLTRARSASEIPTSALCFLPERERQRGLAEDGSQHHVVDHHGQGEAAGEAHADDADPGTATALVLRCGQGAQPHRDGARLLQRETGELPRDAGRPEGLQGVPDRRRAAGFPEEVRQHRGAARRRHAASELRHLGRDPGHLADDDDGGTGADAVDVAAFAAGLEGVLGEAVQRGLPPPASPVAMAGP